VVAHARGAQAPIGKGRPAPDHHLRRRVSDKEALLKDPELLAEAKKAILDIQYVSGEETEGVVQGLVKIEPAFIARMKQVLVP
jgi:hypothetical protein